MARIQGLLAVYFLVLLLQTLLERELRRAMARGNVPSLPLYPEGRACLRPTTQKIIELFEPIQRHAVLRAKDSSSSEDQEPLILITTLTPGDILRMRSMAGPALTQTAWLGTGGPTAESRATQLKPSLGNRLDKEGQSPRPMWASLRAAL